MQVSDASSKPTFLPFWMRVVMTCLMFAVTAVSMWKGFRRFEWVSFLCFGLYYMFYLPRQKGEGFVAYVRKPRAVASLALLVAVVVGAIHNLHYVFMK